MLDTNIEYTISEAADITGYAPHVLRFYEKEFNIEIPRKDSNHRYYTYKELELIQYIKDLQDKGFGNKQIKMIINSPEIILNKNNNRNSMVLNESEDSNIDLNELSLQITESLSESFLEKITSYLAKENRDTSELIEDLKGEIMALKNEIHSKERDILITENAKLKMKVKEKTYENVKIKEELLRLKNQKRGLFSKIFNSGKG